MGFDIGFGYDFGKTRIEGNWNRGKSDGGVFAGVAFTDDTKIDSLSLSGYYDFRADKLWSPFVGISIASSKVAINNFEDN